MPNHWPPSNALPYVPTESETDVLSSDQECFDPELVEGWGWIEVFIVIQLMWGVLLFIPGMQPFRAYIRALPYVTSLAALIYYFQRAAGELLPPGAGWLVASFGLLALNLFHEETQVLAGIAQIVFQISIAAPAFWVACIVRSKARFLRILWVIFGASLISAAVGVLQVYYPELFLPPEFSALALRINPAFVESLTYVGANGESIIRPPGVTDLPGGAGIAGTMTMVLGVALATHGHRSRVVRAACFGAAGIGMTVLYLTQIRSLTILAVVSVLIFAALRLRQGHVVQGGAIAITGTVLVVASFTWALAVGGEAISERFAGLGSSGFLSTFQANRGIFLDYTLNELLFQFPFGAGLGRWGMMEVYFGDRSVWQFPPIHVEIQPTGWLLDGGVLMWICYGGALAAAVRYGYLIAVRSASQSLQYFAAIVLSIQLMIIGFCFSGPAFNTQLGIEFWAVTAALFGVAQKWQTWHETEAPAGMESDEEDCPS